MTLINFGYIDKQQNQKIPQNILDELKNTRIFRKEVDYDLNNFIRFDLSAFDNVKLWSVILLPLLPSLLYAVSGIVIGVSYDKSAYDKVGFFKTVNDFTKNAMQNYKPWIITGIIVSFMVLSIICFFFAKWVFSGQFKQGMFQIYKGEKIWEHVSPEAIKEQDDELKKYDSYNKTDNPTSFAKVKNNIDKRYFDIVVFNEAGVIIEQDLLRVKRHFNKDTGTTPDICPRAALDLEYKKGEAKVINGVEQDNEIKIYDGKTHLFSISFAKLANLIAAVGSCGVQKKDNPLNSFLNGKYCKIEEDHSGVITKKWIDLNPKPTHELGYTTGNLCLALEQTLSMLHEIGPSNELTLGEKIANKLFYKNSDKSYRMLPTTTM